MDCIVNRNTNDFTTSVYTKPTHGGDCINFNSLCPERYKLGVIKTLLHRAYTISSTWHDVHQEIVRIKQLLTDNNYPMQTIDREINRFITSKIDSPLTPDPPPPPDTRLYFEHQMTSNYKNEEKSLHNIIDKHIKPTNPSAKVKLIIYYRNRKLRNLFIKNKPNIAIDPALKHHVVYQYTCDKGGCNSNNKYIGYTTTTLYQRFGSHTQSGSIRKHLTEEHGITSLKRRDLLESTQVLHQDDRRRDLIFMEALLIKELSPTLNAQDEGCELILKIFKH